MHQLLDLLFVEFGTGLEGVGLNLVAVEVDDLTGGVALAAGIGEFGDKGIDALAEYRLLTHG